MFLEFQYVLLMEIQKLTKIDNEILEQLTLERLLAMATQNMDTLEPVTAMQKFDVEGDKLKLTKFHFDNTYDSKEIGKSVTSVMQQCL